MTIRLTIDAMPILVGSGGISNYVGPLIEHFTKISNPNFVPNLHFRTASRHRRRLFKDFLLRRHRTYNDINYTRTNLPDRLLKVLWSSRWNLLNSLTLPKADVYLATTEMIPLHSPIRRVAIVHDLTPALIPQFFHEKEETYLQRTKALLNSCHALVAVSKTTRDNIVTLCGFEKEKIHVIYTGLPSIPRTDSSDDPTLDQLGVRKPFILYVGALAPNKNVEGVIRCFARFIKKTGLDWQLVLVGKSFMREGYYERIAGEEGILGRVVLTGWLDEKKWALFRNAELLIHLSWYEGFGLPLTEAIALGLPVLASNRGAFPEVIQNNEQIVDPEDEDQVAERLARFAQDPAVRSRWKEYMNKRAKDFNWGKSALKLLALLQSL